MESGLIHWVVSNDLTGQIREGQNKWWIASGRGTNDPTLLAAGPSVRLNTTRWRYWDGSGYKEQPGINLTNTMPQPVLARDPKEWKLTRYQSLSVSIFEKYAEYLSCIPSGLIGNLVLVATLMYTVHCTENDFVLLQPPLC